MVFFHGSTALLIVEVAWSRSVRHTTIGRTPLDEWLARRRDLYLTTHNNQKRQTSMHPAAFEPAIPASERSQTHALDGAATAIDSIENTGLYLTQNFPDDPGIRITGRPLYLWGQRSGLLWRIQQRTAFKAVRSNCLLTLFWKIKLVT